MLDLLLTLLITCVVLGGVWYIITLIPLPHPFASIVRIVFGIIAFIILIYLLFGLLGTSGGDLWLRR